MGVRNLTAIILPCYVHWVFSTKQRRNCIRSIRNWEIHDSQNTEDIYRRHYQMGRDQPCLKKLLASTSRISLLILLVKKLFSK